MAREERTFFDPLCDLSRVFIPTELLLVSGRRFLFSCGTFSAALKMKQQTVRTEFQGLQLYLWENIPKCER